MNLIVDASVVAKWLFREIDSEKAERVLDGWAAGSLTLYAPEILPLEVASAVLKRVVRESLPEKQALELFGRFFRYCPQLVPLLGLAEPALSLAIRQRQWVYDCLYVTLSEELGCDFLTADERLHAAFGAATRRVRLLRDWA